MNSATSDAVAIDNLSPSQFTQTNDNQLRRDILDRQLRAVHDLHDAIEHQNTTFARTVLYSPNTRTATTTHLASDGSDTSDVLADELKVIDLPQYKPLPGRPNQCLAALQEWEGVVTAVDNDLVHVSMIDLTAGGKSTEDVAEIPLNEISEDDRSRVMPGAIFRWVIGYLRTASGTQMNSSVIYFRRANDRRQTAEVPRMIFESND